MQTGGMTTSAQPVDLLALFDPAVRADPYPLYARAREASPMLVAGGQVAVVAGYDDCLAVLRHPQALSDRRRSAAFAQRAAAMADGVPEGMQWAVETPSFLFLDPPDHTRLRRLVAQAFTARRVEQLRPTIERLTADLLDAAGSEMNVIDELAYPLPLTVIADLLGVPREDTPRLRGWSAVLTRALDPSVPLTGQPAEGLERRMTVLTEFREYFQRLVEQRRRDPGDDLVSALTAVEDGGDRLSSEELLSTCVLLLVAGHETTVNLIANGVLALLRHPDQLTMLAADPGLAPGTVEEALRYDPPVQLMMRVAGEDLTVGGTTVPSGSIVLLLLAAASRDPAANEEPDRFDIGRTQPRHLAFGFGAHFCLGAPLARLEAQVALAAFARRFPQARVASSELQYRDNVTLRGLTELPILTDG
jgi:cytochrome P450